MIAVLIFKSLNRFIEEIIARGCISKKSVGEDKTARKNPFILPGGWPFDWDGKITQVTTDEVKDNVNKPCLKKEKEGHSMSLGENEAKGEPIIINICMCDNEDHCNTAAYTGFCGVVLIFINTIPLLNHWIFSRLF